jgi:uncharacterized protein YjbI with pentapeptide repeats
MTTKKEGFPLLVLNMGNCANYFNINAPKSTFKFFNTRSSRFANCNFTNSLFEKVSFHDTLFLNCNLQKSKFLKIRKAGFAGNVIFEGCNLSNSHIEWNALGDDSDTLKFRNCDLSYVSFKNSYMYNVRFMSGNKMNKTRFDNSELYLSDYTIKDAFTFYRKGANKVGYAYCYDIFGTPKFKHIPFYSLLLKGVSRLYPEK